MRGSFGCCGAAAAVFQFEARRREAQRYARIGEATDDFEEEDFVDVEAEDGGEDDDDDGLPQLSPPPAQPAPLAPPAQAAPTPQAVATPVTPAAPQVDARAASRRYRGAPTPHARNKRPMPDPSCSQLEPDLLDFSQPPPSAASAVAPGTTTESWVAEMESELAEFDRLTTPVVQMATPSGQQPGTAPVAGWQASMQDELAQHLANT